MNCGLHPSRAAGTMLLELSFRETESDPSGPWARHGQGEIPDSGIRCWQSPAKRTGSNLLLAELPINASSYNYRHADHDQPRLLRGPFANRARQPRALAARRSDGRGAALSGGLSVAGRLEAQSAVIAGDPGCGRQKLSRSRRVNHQRRVLSSVPASGGGARD